MRDSTEHVPRIIPLLQDPEPTVVRAACAALKSLSDERDYGPPLNPTEEERQQAIDAWSQWWQRRSKAR